MEPTNYRGMKMSQLYILKEVDKVTEIAKNIFGDIVSKVYYATCYYEHLGDKNRDDDYFDYLIKHSFNSETSIEQDGKDIIIEFTNGRKVIFSNSEWGAMDAFSDNEVQKVI